jgi:dephospho-CoA kinase
MVAPLSSAPVRVGLTGGIGCGKSSVAQRLVALGAGLVDTDAIARELTAPGGGAIEAVREEFGADFIDEAGALDRARMRELAFGDPRAKRRLEAILHPMIGVEAERRAAACHASVCVFDVPLLVESVHWRDRVDRVLVVDCTEATQVERVMQRSGWSREAVMAVIGQQARRLERLSCADAVIDNDRITLEALDAEVAALWSLWHHS